MPADAGPGGDGGARRTLLDALRHAQHVGLIGPDFDAQVAHADAMAWWIEQELGIPSGWVDLGAGGGLPSLVFLDRWSDAHAVLVDARARAVRELELAVATMAIEDRVTVLGVRAEVAGRDPALREQSELVVARGFGPPAVTAECAAALVAVAGSVIVSEPPGSVGERWPAEGLFGLGLVVESVSAGPPGFVRLRKVAPVDERTPRRAGVLEKRPHW